jgi:hypothetical protein
MAKRLLFVLAVCGGLAAPNAPAFAAELYAQLFPLTGEIRLLNKSAAPVPFVFYSISSDGNALNGSNGVWKSITQNYDRPAGATPGNGFIDPNGDWIKLSSTSAQLAEGALDADGGRLLATRAISLGYVWDPYAVPFPDLVFEVRTDSQVIPITIELALDGDYSSNQVVDQADYVVWRKYVNSMSAYFADGDLDGVVDMDDYVIWRDNFGLTLPLPPYIAGGGGGLASLAPLGCSGTDDRGARLAGIWLPANYRDATRHANTTPPIALTRRHFLFKQLHALQYRLLNLPQHFVAGFAGDGHVAELHYECIRDAVQPPALNGHNAVSFALDQFVDVIEDLREPHRAAVGARDLRQLFAEGLANPSKLCVVQMSAGAQQIRVAHARIERPTIELVQEF